MAMPVIPVPEYPNVPNDPGVPPLARPPRNTVANTIIPVAGVVGLARRLLLGTQWGIYSEAGLPLLLGDSVKAFDFKEDARLADFPIEKGGFGQYNKVQTPYDARLSFVVGAASTVSSVLGSSDARADFLAVCKKLLTTLEIVSVVTPDVSYPSANVVHYSYARTSQNGVTLLTVDVWVQEVRRTATTAFTNAGTQEPSGASTVSGGTVQAQTPNPAQAAAEPVPGGLY